jgi:hypothetical protein
MNRDLRLAIVLMVIFAILFGISFTFQSSDAMTTHTTAAFFPRVVLILLMFLTLLLIIVSIVKGSATPVNKKMERNTLIRVLGSMVACILLGLGASYLGTLVSIALFIIAVMLIWGVRNKLAILLNAIITPILIHLVFTKILWVQLPSGILK